MPLFAYFLIGAALRASGVIGREHAAVFFRLVFHVTLPALAFVALVDASLGGQSALLPCIGFIVNACTLAFAWFATRASTVARADTGIILLGASIANMVFMFPFVLAALGPAALADAVLIDFGNAVFVATVSNALAIRFGHAGEHSVRQSALRLLRTPLFLALLAAIIVNLAGWRVPGELRAILEPLGAGTIPLTLIALGIALNVAHLGELTARLTVVLRMAAGCVVGVVLAAILGLEGSRALVVVASAAAPVGFNAVTLASIARLDTEKAAAAVSLAVLIGIPVTVLILWLGPMLPLPGL